MRYYSIEIIGNDNNPVQAWTTHPNGLQAPPDQGAPLIELDITQANLADPINDSFVRVWGISPQTAAQATKLINLPITVKGGMGKGLPLVNSSQVGILAQGYVWTAFANWIGTNMTLEMYLKAIATTDQLTANVSGFQAPPANINIDWPAETRFENGIASSLHAAYPKYQLNINISHNLTVQYDIHDTKKSLEEFSTWVKQLSQQVIGGSYSGVLISVLGNTITVTDSESLSQTGPTGSGSPPAVKDILFTDMVGQVTWLSPQTIHLPVVMRGDLNVLTSRIRLPPGQMTTVQNSLIQYRDQAAIQGTFYVNSIRHNGNSRQPDGLSWVTNIFASVSV